MRRLSVHRPKAKVRNSARHLRALRAWAESAKGKYPSRQEDKYVNWRIPVLDRLVDAPTARHEWQVQALESLLIAACHFVEAKPETEKGRSWVAVLVGFPNMWSSEVTVFFDRDYYESFLAVDEQMRHHSLCKEMGLAVPAGMIEVGSMAIWEEEDEQGRVFQASEERWIIGEPISL